MSLSFCTLASGSKGNAILIKHHDQALLVDCGLSAKELLRRVELAGLAAHQIKAIWVTHEHRDHAVGVGVAARRLGCPVYASQKTWGGMENLAKVRHRAFTVGESLELAGMVLHPFSTSHDAADPAGLVVEAGGQKLGLATDLGQPTALVRQRLAGARALIVESNHDPRMLTEGPYPPYLQQRVRGRLGHLSNQQGAELLAELCHPGLAHVVLAHLSETNNTPVLAEASAGASLDQNGFRGRLYVAGQNVPGPLIRLE